jgi:hypothetical protein
LVIKASNEHDFLIEEAIDGKELGTELFESPSFFAALYPQAVVDSLWPKVGEYLNQMHRVKTQLYVVYYASSKL